MFKQTEAKYKSIKLGMGSGSIYAYGCYLVSLVNGLNLKGYSFTPESLNDYFKTKELWVGESKNYIDVDSLSKKLPDIFASFLKAEPFEDKKLAEYVNKGLVIVAKVDARAIGGTGTHFVLVTKYDGKVAKIFDSWFGDEQLVTKRYSKYNNLLGLRVFDIKQYKETTTPEITNGNLKEEYNELKTDYDELRKRWNTRDIEYDLLRQKNEDLLQAVDDLRANNKEWQLKVDELVELNLALVEETKLLNAIKNSVLNLFRSKP